MGHVCRRQVVLNSHVADVLGGTGIGVAVCLGFTTLEPLQCMFGFCWESIMVSDFPHRTRVGRVTEYSDLICLFLAGGALGKSHMPCYSCLSAAWQVMPWSCCTTHQLCCLSRFGIKGDQQMHVCICCSNGIFAFHAWGGAAVAAWPCDGV